MTTSYGKPHLTVPEQIALLKGRGMLISDEVKAAHALQRIGYYRLSGYWYHFRKSISTADANGKQINTVLEEFKDHAKCGDVVDLYVFDKELRLLFLDALERVEVGLRVDIALLLSKRDPWAHRDPGQLHTIFAREQGKRGHAAWLAKLDDLEDKSKEEFVVAFRQKYIDRLPLWSAIELWDFGALSIFLSGMKDADVSVLATKYGFAKRDMLTSWVRSLNYVRNVAAHHGRLWNRQLVDRPKPPKVGELPDLDHLATDSYAQTRIYAAAVTLRWFLRVINPSTSWPMRLKAHFLKFPNNPHFALHQTGFPVGWERHPFWTN